MLVPEISLITSLVLIIDNLSGVGRRPELLRWRSGEIMLEPHPMVLLLLEVLGLSLEILEGLRLLEHLLWRNRRKIRNPWLKGWGEVWPSVAKGWRSSERVLRHLEI